MVLVDDEAAAAGRFGGLAPARLGGLREVALGAVLLQLRGHQQQVNLGREREGAWSRWANSMKCLWWEAEPPALPPPRCSSVAASKRLCLSGAIASPRAGAPVTTA